MPNTNATRLSNRVLGSIRCTPGKVAIGESVCIEVLDPRGVPYDNHETVPISINGVPGSKHYLVWRTGGTKTITVVAGARGRREMAQATVIIEAPAAGRRVPEFTVHWRPDRPTTAIFRLANRRMMRLGGATPAIPATHTRPAAGGTTGRVVAAARIANVASGNARMRNGSEGEVSAVYEWRFGETGFARSVSAEAAQDFGPHLDPNRLHSVFHVTVTEQFPGEQPVSVTRSVVVMNPYHLMKGRGVLQPPVASSDTSVRYGGGQWRAAMTVRNPEAVDLKLSARRIECIYADPKRASKRLASESVNVVLRAGTATRIPVTVAANLLPPEVVSFAVHFSGTGPNGLPVRVAGWFDVPEHRVARSPLPAGLQSALQTVISRGLVANSSAVSFTELKDLAARGSISATTLAFPRGQPKPMNHQAPLPAKEGQECEPWNLPALVPPGLACVPTSEPKPTPMPARFMNAMKGDIVITPYNGSLISRVLLSVDPPQLYAHSGIMTRNQDEITHSTACQERAMDPDNFIDGDGIRPDVLKYLWPGVITQTIEQAVDGETKLDPETGKTYTIGGFSTMEWPVDLGGAAPQITPAMVIKPKPDNDDQVRAKLHEIADYAAQQAGKSHYRFYCYTDPTIGLTQKAPAEAGWAAGTYPSVCSSFIWMALRKAGVPMEGTLEGDDMNKGAQITTGTPDGLYLYTAEERLAAGMVMFHEIKELVEGKVSSLEDNVSDIVDDVANQILNTFACDWSDTAAKDSDKWMQTQDANAVSPSNLMFYDAPWYGYAEPLIYREARVEQVPEYHWKKVTQYGSVSGIVRNQGKPAAGAYVWANSTAHAAYSKADGAFAITGVEAGKVILSAQLPHNGELLAASMDITVPVNATAQVTIDLKGPSEDYRRVWVAGTMLTVDYEFAAAAYPSKSDQIVGYVNLSPADSPHKVLALDVAADDACGRLLLTFDLLSDHSVKVTPKIRCYASNAPDTDDYDEWPGDSFVVKPGVSHAVSKWIYVDGSNYAYADYTVTNKRN
jgi:hypothetical protein